MSCSWGMCTTSSNCDVTLLMFVSQSSQKDIIWHFLDPHTGDYRILRKLSRGLYIKFRCHCLTSAKISQSAKSNSVRNSLHVCLIHLIRNSSTMDSDSDFGFGGSGDEDASFTPSHEEEEQQQDENIVLAIVTPTTQKKKWHRFSLQEKLCILRNVR